MSTLFDPDPDVPDARDTDARHDLRSPTVTETEAEAVTETETDVRRPSIPHLVVGMVFLGMAALWALAASGAVSSDDTWLLPGLLIIAGATGLVAALVGSRRRER